MSEVDPLDKVTLLVINYQDKHNEKDLKELVKLFNTELGDLVWSIIKYYGILNYPPLILEEIVEECENEIFLKCLAKFDRTRKAKFTTYYSWELRSCINARKCQFLRKNNVRNTVSLSECYRRDFDTSENVKEVAPFLTFNKRTLMQFKKCIKDIFSDNKSIYVKYPLEEKVIEEVLSGTNSNRL
jgi:hypothetical protein